MRLDLMDRRGAARCALTDVGVGCTHHNNPDAVLVQRPSSSDGRVGLEEGLALPKPPLITTWTLY